VKILRLFNDAASTDLIACGYTYAEHFPLSGCFYSKLSVWSFVVFHVATNVLYSLYKSIKNKPKDKNPIHFFTDLSLLPRHPPKWKVKGELYKQMKCGEVMIDATLSRTSVQETKQDLHVWWIAKVKQQVCLLTTCFRIRSRNLTFRLKSDVKDSSEIPCMILHTRTLI